MIKYTATTDWGRIYENAITAAGIPHLTEVTPDDDLEIFVITFTVDDEHAKKVSEIMHAARIETLELLCYFRFRDLREACSHFGLYNALDAVRMLQDIYEEDNAPPQA